MSDELHLWLARLGLLAAAAVWLPRLVAALRGRGRWWGPWWPPALLLVTTVLVLAGLAFATDEPIGDLFDAALWREAAGDILGR